MFSFPLLLLCVCIFCVYIEHACLDEHMCCYLYITGMQQLCPISLPFKSIFLILHVTSLSCCLLNTMFVGCGSKSLQCHILDTYALCLKVIE